MKKIFFSLFTVLCFTGFLIFSAPHTYATPDIVIKTTTSDGELFDDAIQNNIIPIPKNTPLIVLLEAGDWTKVKHKEVIGFIKSEHLKFISPQQMPGKTAPSKITNQKKIALTFDDGPHPKVTMQILKTLKKYDAKATFFVVGQEVKKHPKIVKAAFEAGHEIGNHTFNHSKLTTLSTKQMKLQIQSTDVVIKVAIGQNATVFRPPYGAYNKSIINHLDIPLTMWTIDTLDWKHRDPKKTVQAINKQVKNGSIILMHDIHQTTADALENILITLQKQGYEFVTVSELTQK